MSYVELKSKDVTVCKSHMCEWCAETIKTGTKSHYRTYVFHNEFKSGWMHIECWNAMHEYIAKYGSFDLLDGWVPGDWKRGSIEGN